MPSRYLTGATCTSPTSTYISRRKEVAISIDLLHDEYHDTIGIGEPLGKEGFERSRSLGNGRIQDRALCSGYLRDLTRLSSSQTSLAPPLSASETNIACEPGIMMSSGNNVM